MARIGGINIPEHKHVVIGLTHIFGIGRSTAAKICSNAGVDPTTKIENLTEDELSAVRNAISGYKIEGDLRREVSLNIKRLGELRTYRGLRHKKGLPVRGQRTKTNARTRKGRRKSKAKKK